MGTPQADGALPRPTGRGRGRKAADQLAGEVYDRLRALARRYLRRESPGHSLQATALVHETYLRLAELREIDWQGRTHFVCVAASQMRRVLVDHARAEKAAKRGDRRLQVTLGDDHVVATTPLEMLDLHEALADLGERHARQQRVAELRLFGGLRFTEIAECLGNGERTVRQDWTVARAWLARRLRGGAEIPR